MERNKTTLALAGIAAVLFGYIAFVDEGTLSTGEVEGRRGRVVERFVRARVKRLEITHGDVHVVMVRDQEMEEDMDTFDVGTWELTEPVTGPVDVDAVDSLLSAVEWLDAQRELEGLTAEDRTRFGFDEPRATLVFEVATETHTILVGGEDPVAGGVYVQVDDVNHAYVVGSDFLEALTHDVEHFRSKELFPDFRTADVRTALLTRTGEGAETLRLVHEQRRWWMREPADMLARDSKVEELLRTLRDLRAERFLGESEADVPGVELGARTLTVSFAPWPDGSSHEGDDRPDQTLRVGGPCPDHASERVARVGQGPIVCVAESTLEVLDVPSVEYRELRLLATPDDDIERIVALGEGVDFTLSRVDGDWTLLQGEHTTPADPGAIAEWVAELREQSAASFVAYDDAAAAAHGLSGDDASVTLTVHRTDSDESEVVRLGTSDADGVWVRRGEEAQLAQFSLATGALMAPSAVRFRARMLVDRSRDDLASFTVVRDGADETLHQEGSSWAIERPVAGPADAGAVGDFTVAFAPLTALRFVAGSPSREHGLDAPRFIVRASFDASSEDDEAAEDDEHEHDHGEDEDEEVGEREDEEVGEGEDESEEPLEVTVRIGAATEGGAFAQLEGDSAVFVLADALVDALASPFVSRDALSIAASEIESITFERPAGSHTLSRMDASWQLDGAAAPSEATLAMLDALAGLRALGATRYGTPGARSSALALRIRRRDGTDVVIDVGAVNGEGDAAYHEVWRTPDVPAGMRVAPAAIERMLGYPPG